MKILNEYPPNIEAIRKVFTFTRRVIFCYGDYIYNPSGVFVDRAMIVHEKVHSDRQKEIGVRDWWNKYLADPEFRIQEEVLAYGAQYKTFSKYASNKEVSIEYAKKLATALSGDTYGNCISFKDALLFITS